MNDNFLSVIKEVDYSKRYQYLCNTMRRNVFCSTIADWFILRFLLKTGKCLHHYISGCVWARPKIFSLAFCTLCPSSIQSLEIWVDCQHWSRLTILFDHACFSTIYSSQDKKLCCEVFQFKNFMRQLCRALSPDSRSEFIFEISHKLTE